jgi:hypothetical protein
MRSLIRRQESIIRRFRHLDAPREVVVAAEELRRIMTNSVQAALAHRDGLIAAMEKYPPNGVVGAMQFGLLAPHWTVDDLGIADQTSFSSPSQGRADAPAIRYRVAISAKS